MKTTLLTILLAMVSLCGYSQNKTIKNVDYTSSNDIFNKLPRNALFLFDDFIDGIVFFKDGTKSYARLNYNTVIDEMQFLDAQNNIMAIGNCNEIELITIRDQNFYYISGRAFGQLIVNGNIKLLALRHTECKVDSSKPGAYGQPSETTAISNINKDSPVFGNYKTMERYKDIKYKIIDEFLIEKRGKFHIIKNIKTLFKIFPEYKNEINNYFEKNKIEITKEQDLINLINFCNNLYNNKE
jgi:hypothetical protein